MFRRTYVSMHDIKKKYTRNRYTFWYEESGFLPIDSLKIQKNAVNMTFGELIFVRIFEGV